MVKKRKGGIGYESFFNLKKPEPKRARLLAGAPAAVDRNVVPRLALMAPPLQAALQAPPPLPTAAATAIPVLEPPTRIAPASDVVGRTLGPWTIEHFQEDIC